MKRQPEHLEAKVFDVLVIGAGVYGAAVAWEASSRGLSVALVEREDFGSKTSANSLKIIHGGLRYLQTLDFARMRHSIFERKTMLRIAPHLVHPLPCLMPTDRSLGKGRAALGVAMKLNDFVSRDRNAGQDTQKFLPNGRLLSKEETLKILPGLDAGRTTGAAVWYDAFMHNADRLTLSFVLSAHGAGAVVANYMEVVDLIKDNRTIGGARVKDLLTGRLHHVRARVTLNTAGGWIDRVLDFAGPRRARPVPFTKAMNLVMRRSIVPSEYAAALYRPGGPVLFMAPWRGVTVVGTWHLPYRGAPDSLRVTEEDIASFINEINRAYPAAKVTREDVKLVNIGLLPGREVPRGSGRVKIDTDYQLIDHAAAHGYEGLMTLIGVKFTTARGVAEKAVNQIFTKLGKPAALSVSATLPVAGGNTGAFGDYLSTAASRLPQGVDAETLRHLVLTYGTLHTAVLGAEKCHRRLPFETPILEAEVRYAVREEMAQHLTDVVLRRTELGTKGDPGLEALTAAARIMAEEFGWSARKITEEIDACRAFFAQFAPPRQKERAA